MSSIGERLWDDETFGDPNSPRHLPLLDTLLDELRLLDAADEEKRAGIRAWLAANQPLDSLVRSIGRSAYGDTLDVLQRDA
jgi:hypothetical protein